MLNDLLLLSGNDIPYADAQAQIVIHQPKIREIALIGEDSFYTGCGVLNFSKDNLIEQDKISLENQSDFEILMSIMMDSSHSEMRESRLNANLVLALLFPEYKIQFSRKAIFLKKGDEIHSIDSKNFEKFKEILKIMFCLNSGEGGSNYNPGGDLAKRIADKLKKRQQILASQKGEQKISILSQYSSILAVGMNIDLNKVLDYTIYQLFDQYTRFDLKEQFDRHFQAQLAGARNLEEIDHWKKDIHS